MELIKNILNSNFANNTLFKNCQFYKVRRYNSATTQNFTFSELETFKQKNTNRFGLPIAHYHITKPSEQKAVKIHNLICDIVAFCCFVSAFIILTTL